MAASSSTLHCGLRGRPDGLAPVNKQLFEFMDSTRRAQGDVFAALGLGPNECAYHIIAQAPLWRLRAYSARTAGPPLLIVAAPIKKPYIWDIAPGASAVSYCLGHGVSTYLLEWLEPRDGHGDIGLDVYADQGLSQAVQMVQRVSEGVKPFLIGHSLGGTLAAIYASLEPDDIQGLFVIGAPLCFQNGTSRFRDIVASVSSPDFSDSSIVPGSFLSQCSAMAAPGPFIWSRLLDAVLSVGDPVAMGIHGRVERWALDEVPLPGKLLRETLQRLYQQDRFYAGTLRVGKRMAGPSKITVPILAVVNSADEIVPRGAVQPFLDAVASRDVQLLEYPGDIGVALQHVGMLVGRTARAQVWPKIVAWIKQRDEVPYSQ